MSIITPQFVPDKLLKEAFLPSHEGAEFGELIMVPAFVSGILPVFRLPEIIRERAVNTTGSLPHVIMSLELLGSIFAGNTTSWADPQVLALNPSLAALYTPDDDTKITVVVCCTGVADSPDIISPKSVVCWE